MTKESLTAFLLGPAGLPLAIGLAAYSLYTYRRNKLDLRDGRELPSAAAPVRFWTEVVGALALALFLGFSGSGWLWRHCFA
ncbi:hypothetical protein [Variovorax paradoxus]|uniref:hypothetical protein n=1 Tax=Variovorax paradoxus TaxID=34073 RepID=UPI0030CAF9AC